MPQFVKLKDANTGERVLIAISAIAYVNETGRQSLVTLNNGEEVAVEESYQTVVNRLTKDSE